VGSDILKVMDTATQQAALATVPKKRPVTYADVVGTYADFKDTSIDVSQTRAEMIPLTAIIHDEFKKRGLGRPTITSGSRQYNPDDTDLLDENSHAFGFDAGLDFSVQGLSQQTVDAITSSTQGKLDKLSGGRRDYQVFGKPHGTAPHIHGEFDPPTPEGLKRKQEHRARVGPKNMLIRAKRGF
jgi:hypothetical protein